jgi:multidrug transporter EmrE-like cation transporter
LRSWIFLFLAIAANIGANISFKYFVQNTRFESSWPSVGRNVLQPSFLIGCFFGFMLLGCYLSALRGLPLSSAYTVATSLSIVGITCAGVFLYGEVLSVRALTGIAIVLVGVTLLASS